MKKLLVVIGITLAFAIAVFGMTACPGGSNQPSNPKGQVVNQPGATPPASTQPSAPPAGGTAPAGGGTAPAGGGEKSGGDTGGEEEMPGGGE